jgi:hypothetical protein
VLNRHLKEKSLEELYDTVVIPALSLAEQDRHRNDLDEETALFIYQSTREFIEDLSDKSADELAAIANSAANKTPTKSMRVICVPASGEADEIIGVMLSQLLVCEGHEVQCISNGTVDETLAQAGKAPSDIFCISAIPPLSLTHARTIYAKLRAQFPSQPIIIGLWNYSGDLARAASRIDSSEVVVILTTLAQVVLQVKKLAELDGTAPEQTPPVVSGRASD